MESQLGLAKAISLKSSVEFLGFAWRIDSHFEFDRRFALCLHLFEHRLHLSTDRFSISKLHTSPIYDHLSHSITLQQSKWYDISSMKSLWRVFSATKTTRHTTLDNHQNLSEFMLICISGSRSRSPQSSSSSWGKKAQAEGMTVMKGLTAETNVGIDTCPSSKIILHGCQVPRLFHHHNSLLSRTNRRYLRRMLNSSLPTNGWKG